MISFNGNGNDAIEGPDLTEFIKPTDEATAVPRPSGIGEFYVEKEYGEAEDEQRHAHEEKGEVEARGAETKADALAHEAEAAVRASNEAQEQGSTARRNYDHAKAVLGPLVRRPTNAKLLYWFRLSWILGGDTVGVAGAALLLGELPLFALMQAMSASISAVTLGAVGRELRYLIAARGRHKGPDDLTEEERPFAAFFAGSDTGERLLRVVVLACATGGVLVAGGIFALRSATEGLAAGLVFGCLALALGLASMYNSYDCADDVAEHLDYLIKEENRLEKKAESFSAAQVIKEHHAAETEAASIKRGCKMAGEAAAAAIRRKLWATLGGSPGAAGNGTASAVTEAYSASGNNHHRERVVPIDSAES